MLVEGECILSLLKLFLYFFFAKVRLKIEILLSLVYPRLYSQRKDKYAAYIFKIPLKDLNKIVDIDNIEKQFSSVRVITCQLVWKFTHVRNEY